MTEPAAWDSSAGSHFAVYQSFNGLCGVCPNMAKFSATLAEARVKGNLRFSGTADECWDWIDAQPKAQPPEKPKPVTQLLLFEAEG